MGIEEQAPATPPPQAATEDLLTPRNLRILRANNRAVRQGKVAPFSAMLKLEKASAQLMARNALLEDELARVKAAQALDKATRGSKKKQRYPEGQLYDPLYQEEHAGELAVRKAEEEEARRKRRRTARARRNETEPNAAHACTPGPSGTS
ncbi:hypothetical protein C366_04497 [Cryptococcus neoformans Tu401-1]|nr:hypothetical protein C366_04497 [Cryptococcus neoformans var. grubii Tu401-1]